MLKLKTLASIIEGIESDGLPERYSLSWEE
jgi:hypothetical protein